MASGTSNQRAGIALRRRMKNGTAEEDRSYEIGLVGDPEYVAVEQQVPDRSATQAVATATKVAPMRSTFLAFALP